MWNSLPLGGGNFYAPGKKLVENIDSPPMGTQIRPIPPPIEMRPRWGGITHQAKSWLRLVSWGGNRKSGGGILRKILAIPPPHHGGGIGEMTKFRLILSVFAQN